MSKTNISPWQKDVVGERDRLIDIFMSELTDQKVKFNYITDLAKALAKMISTHEAIAWNEHTKDAGKKKKHIRKPRGCSHVTLLRETGPYRAKLNAWWAVYGVDSEQKEKAIKEIATIQSRLENATLSKRLELYKNRVKELEAELDSWRTGSGLAVPKIEFASDDKGVSNDTAKVCKAIYLIVNEFESQMTLHDGRLAVNNFTKRTIVDKETLEPYMRWLKLHENINVPSVEV